MLRHCYYLLRCLGSELLVRRLDDQHRVLGQAALVVDDRGVVAALDDAALLLQLGEDVLVVNGEACEYAKKPREYRVSELVAARGNTEPLYTTPFSH